MGGFSAEKARELFNLPPGIEPVTMITVGYLGDPEQLSESLKANELAQQQRKTIEELILNGEASCEEGLVERKRRLSDLPAQLLRQQRGRHRRPARDHRQARLSQGSWHRRGLAVAVYQSPNDDNGYDISDYRDIMDDFGTLADWEELLAGLHQRGIKLVMDLVVNHTSDEHPWFVESRKSVDNPYRDYYIWRPPKDGREPNNWASYFSPSAWQLDETTGEYYLHLFSRKQPDLNWENPSVRAEVFELMRWWLDKGIDGFRMDVINLLSKSPGLPDAPVVTQDRYQWGGECFPNGPRLFEFLQEMKEQVLSAYDILTVGETPAVTPQDAIALTNEETGFLSMVFQFEHMDLDADREGGLTRPQLPHWNLLELKQVMTRWQKGLEGRGWNSLYLSNHDQPRWVSRFADDGRYRVESAKMLATFLHFQQGTPYIYQGEEIGMTNVAFESIADYRDIATRHLYREAVEAHGVDPQLACGRACPEPRQRPDADAVG